MLTLKAGILSSKNNISSRNECTAMASSRRYTLYAKRYMLFTAFTPLEVIPESWAMHLRRRLLTGFTFVEVIVALAIVSISLLALLRLHMISISMADTAQITSQAVFLADEKIAETLALGYPEVGTDSGTVEKSVLYLHWQTEVTHPQSPQLDEANITGLRKILVDVSWKQGVGRKHLQMSTYVADRKLNEQ